MAAQQHIQVERSGSNPTSGLFRKSEWEVRPCSLEIVQALVRQHHYSRGGSNTRTYTHGLFRRGALWEQECRGVAWWFPPTMDCAIANYPKNPNGVLSLSRLVVVPGMPTNACSFLIRHAMRHFMDRKRWPFLITFADEWQGHDGKIYLAAGWTFAGYTKPSPVYVLNGRMLSRKRGNLTRTHAEMLALGCEYKGQFRRKRFTHLEE